MNYFRRLLCLLPGLLWLQQSIAQEVRVSGVVTSRTDAQRVPGAIVRVKGTNIGTQTDPDGKYSINAHEKDTLQVTSLGFEPPLL